MICYKEYEAQKEVEQGASAADKSTPEEEEDWGAEPSLPTRETPPGASSMAPSQEDEWKWMINQDPRLGSITGDSGHGTMTATWETESIEDVEELTGAVGVGNKSASGEYLSDVKWRDDDPLFVFDDDNVNTAPSRIDVLVPRFQGPLAADYLLESISIHEINVLFDMNV